MVEKSNMTRLSDGKRRFSDTDYILTCPEFNKENLVSCWLCNDTILMKMLMDIYHILVKHCTLTVGYSTLTVTPQNKGSSLASVVP